MNKTSFFLTVAILTTLCLSAFAFVPPPVPAPSSRGSLVGKVTDATGRPIADAAVEVLKTAPRLGSYSREDGSFRVSRLLPGTYTLRVSAPGYKPTEATTVEIKGGDEASCTITLMEPETVEYKEEDLSNPLTLSYSAPEMAEGGGDDAVADMDMPLSPAPTMSEGIVSSSASGRGAATRRADAPKMAAKTLSVSKSKASKGESVRERAADDRAVAVTEEPALSAVIGKGDKDEATVASEPMPETVERAGQLTAGEWSDLEHWAYWRDVISTEEWKGMPGHWGYNTSGRVQVRVTDGGRPAVDAAIRLVGPQGNVVWEGRTNNRGWGELFAGIAGGSQEPHRVEVKTAGGAYMNAGTVTPGSGAPVIANVSGTTPAAPMLDLMFVVDATGSMGDEMSYIKRELEDVIDRVRETTTDDLRIRLSCNFYRDRGDEYLVRAFPFNESSFEVIGQLRKQSANGGGDTPEAVEDALEDAINKHEWSSSARARLMFLVLDAPPHHTPDRLKKLQQLTQQAAAKGIRIIPIASSGIDKETEFLLRLFSIYTEGTYLFLTDDSGIGNSHLKPTVGRYEVQFLNNLMVKVIARYVMDASTSGTASDPSLR